MLILQLLLISSSIWKSRGMPITRSLSSFAGVGVTSILPIPKTQVVLPDDDIGTDISDGSEEDNLLSFYVGTKRGLMKKITINANSETHNDDAVHIECIEEEEEADGSKRKTPYPIFSMMSLSTHHHEVVLSGSGDRYVTMWEHRKQQYPGDESVSSSWRIKAKLGPHTGWVKDLASSISPYLDSNVDDPDNIEEEETFIFSIGCNCIEVWRAVNGESYDHVHKLMIDSSVEMGSTLSSDILCLATSPSYQQSTQQTSSEKGKQQYHHSYYLLAGGVDGRIHKWTICNNSFHNAEVVCAPGHNGRVNALLVCNDLRAAVSIGHDGLVKCWKLDCKENLIGRSVRSINVNDDGYIVQEASSDEASTIKLTCSCILDEKQDLAIIGIGTACGKVLLAEISKRADDDATMSITLLTERATVESSLGGCIIHSIASQNHNIIIGHSKGISIWEPDLHAINTS